MKKRTPPQCWCSVRHDEFDAGAQRRDTYGCHVKNDGLGT